MAIPLFVAALAQQGLGMIADAVMAKGKAVVEEKLGVKIPENASALTPEVVEDLHKRQDEHQRFLIDAAMEAQRDANAAVTDRWRSDMASDNKLSKNVRPITMLGLIVISALLTVIDSMNIGFTVKTHWVELWTGLLMLVAGAYFVGRSVEKGVNIHSSLRNKG